MIKQIANRIYTDFFLPDRLPEWEYFLCKAIENDYFICSIEEFQKKIRTNSVDKSKNYLIIRHDIDTDLSTAKKIWALEKKLKLFTSYYFRLSTINTPLMKDINDCGGEASYHFEELATYAKHKGFTNKKEALAHLDTIRGIFKKNLESLRMQTGAPMHIVASHGDWMNRKLGVTNCVILDDKVFRKDLGIELNNIARYQKKTGVRADIRVVEGDAIEYKIQDDEDFFFMFNPFSAALIEKFARNIMQSLAANDRQGYIIYNNPRFGDALERQGFSPFLDFNKGECIVYRNCKERI